jgi:hypothetical protein
MSHTLHILQPRPRPLAWFHAAGSPSLHVGGLAPLLAVRCLQQHDASHHALLVGNHEAKADAQSVGLAVHASLLPPLHAQSRMGPGLRMLLRRSDVQPGTIVCWGGAMRSALGLVRRCASAAPRATWLWVDVDAGSVHTLHTPQGEAPVPPVALALPTAAQLARALPAPQPVEHEQWGTMPDDAPRFPTRVALLADPAAPGNAADMTALSAVLHAGGLLHTCVILQHASGYLAASRRVVLERGLVAQVLHTSAPLMRWLPACSAAAVFALAQGSHRWALATLVHACIARRVLPVLCEGDARVLGELGCDVAAARLAPSDAPAQLARMLLPALLGGASQPLQLPTLASHAPPYLDAWLAATRSHVAATA